jgi:nucleoid DNA-binding protein
MNERLTTRNLADILAIQTGMEKERAEKFIEQLSSYITQGIEKNKLVKVLGLGTFKVVLVRERESIHIHTGERFVIPAHHKLSFVLDKNLKDQINRPFAFFEPVEVMEETYLLSKKQAAGNTAESDTEYEAVNYEVNAESPATTINDDNFSYFDDNKKYGHVPGKTEEHPIVETDEKIVPDPDELTAETGEFQFVSDEFQAVFEDVPEESPSISGEDQPAPDFVQPVVPEKPWYVSDEYQPMPANMSEDIDIINYEYDYGAEANTYREEDEGNTEYSDAGHTGVKSDPAETAVSDKYYESGNEHKTMTTRILTPLWLWLLLLPFFIVAGVGIATYAFLYYNAKASYQHAASLPDDNSIVAAGGYEADAIAPRPVGATRTPNTDNPAGRLNSAANDMDSPAGGSDDDAIPAQSNDGNITLAATDSIKNDEVVGNAESYENKNEEKRVIDWFAPTQKKTGADSKQSDNPATAAKQAPKQTEQRSGDKTTASTAKKPGNAQAGKTIPARVRMIAGSSLTQIAMEHYGDKVFWVYIYDYNKSRIKDFNNIPVGMEIRLPQPNLYGINAKNRTSLQKARKKQSELLKWDKWDDYQ